MLHKAFFVCSKTTHWGRGPGIELSRCCIVFFARDALVNPTCNHASVWQCQPAEMLAHQIWATADIVIHKNDSFVFCLLPPIIAREWQTSKMHFVVRNQVRMLKNQIP